MSSVQFWGLGSGLNTAEIIDAMLISNQMKIKGYEAKITLANGKKSAWGELKSSIEKMEGIIKDLSGVGKQNFKNGVVSAEGFFTADVKGGAANLDYSINVKQLASKHAVSANKVADINEPLNSEGSFKINGHEINITGEDTLSTLMGKINNAKDADGKSIGAKAYIIDGVMVVESETTGIENSLKFEDTSGILGSLGIVKEDGSINTTKEPQNAIVEINDILVERPTNSIDDAIDGVTLNLTKVTKEAVSLKVGEDTTKIKEMITGFVDSFNGVVDIIGKFTSYDSANGTSGILNGDSSVSSIKNLLTNAMQSKFEGGEFGYLFDVGVSVDRYGKYQIDEKKLDSALSQNAGDVINMFTKGLERPDSPSDSSSGILVTMKNTINSLINGTSNMFKGKTDSIDSQIKSYENMITRQQTYMDKRRKTLEMQFAALETTMSSLNNTSGMLGQMNSANSNN